MGFLLAVAWHGRSATKQECYQTALTGILLHSYSTCDKYFSLPRSSYSMSLLAPRTSSTSACTLQRNLKILVADTYFLWGKVTKYIFYFPDTELHFDFHPQAKCLLIPSQPARTCALHQDVVKRTQNNTARQHSGPALKKNKHLDGIEIIHPSACF